MDQTKAGFVGLTSTKNLDLILEEIFFKMVMPQEGAVPIYVGKIDPL